MFKEETRRVQEEDDQEKRKENGNEHDITIINAQRAVSFVVYKGTKNGTIKRFLRRASAKTLMHM